MTMKSPTALQWTIGSTVGMAGGMLAALVLGHPLETIVGMVAVGPISALVVGVLLGSSQWLALRKRLSHSSLWIAASGLGLGIGLATSVVILEQVGRAITGHRPNALQLSPAYRALSLLILGLVSGLSLGLVESWLLRRERVAGAGWIGASTIGLGLAFPLSSLIVDFLLGGFSSPSHIVVFTLLVGILYGSLTAKGMARVLRPA